MPIKFRHFLRTIVLWQTTFYCNLYVFPQFQFSYYHIKHCFSKVLVHVIDGDQLLHKGVDPFLSVPNRQNADKDAQLTAAACLTDRSALLPLPLVLWLIAASKPKLLFALVLVFCLIHSCVCVLYVCNSVYSIPACYWTCDPACCAKVTGVCVAVGCMRNHSRMGITITKRCP